MEVKSKLKYLNVGCGTKFHSDWTNLDMVAQAPEVIEHNLAQGIPYADNTFDAVYHSQVLEHIPKELAKGFIEECYRVLAPGGILRVVVPDLENIINEYKRLLDINLTNPTPESEANYYWVLLELFDQMVRNKSGGLMADELRKEELINEEYVLDRIGYIGHAIRNKYLERQRKKKANAGAANTSGPSTMTKVKGKVKSMLGDNAANSEEYRLGKLRLGGEIHMWMYDRYSLGKLLTEVGFSEFKLVDPQMSDIAGWKDFELDYKNGMAYDPTSLFMEGRK